ncbi:SMP-30/gluconolactonase/LRE family protein [Oleiharenicola lentus]|uniref:NHL domain-containing protein n=1 Tax=Oleiharenicola lentus TaxID=2508720 RepID=UPI0013E931CE|nr:SMP-30/gluconolactonase/LRE family protein [Oleiharenicola lentus]
MHSLLARSLRRVTFLVGLGGLLGSALAQDYTYSTFAGVAGKGGNLNGSGGNQLVPIFNFPISVAVNPAGDIYVADSANSLIRKVTQAGVVTTFVGTAGRVGGNDGSTTDPNVTFNLPQGTVVDSAGNLYVSDYAGHTIRKITASGTVTTLAGTAATAGTADGTGSAARFQNPSGLAVDTAGNLYVADSGSHVIRKITPAGVVTTVAGTAGSAGNANGLGAAARFFNPRGIAVDSAGIIYVADTGNNMIRRIATDGTVTTLAGAPNTFGGTDGTGAAARFNFPNSLAVDTGGNVYVADQLNSTIRKVTSAGVVTTLAGSAGVAGRVDGSGSAARFDRPTGVAVDSSGNIYVADYRNQLIRKVTSAGVVTTLAGSGGLAGLQNGSGFLLDPVLFRNPADTAVDSAGNIYVSDSGNHAVRKITPDGVTMLFAGSTAGLRGFSNGTGNAASFYSPAGLAFDSAGNLFVADSANHLVRRITPAGEVSSYAGVALTSGTTNGDRNSAKFNYPSGVAVDAAGNVYVADYGNHVIRQISAAGVVSTYAGSEGLSGAMDGSGSSARFNYPRDLAIDTAGNLYVADTGNHVVRRIAPGGAVTTLAGSLGVPGSTDATGSSARFSGPSGVAVDANGNVYVADTNSSTVRKISPSGAVTTIGGQAGSVGSVDGAGSTARFNYPSGLAVDSTGNLYIADNRNHTIRKGFAPGNSGGGGGGGGGGGSGNDGSGGGIDDSSVGSGHLLQPNGITVDALGNYYVCDTANHCIRRVSSTGIVSVLAGRSGTSGTTDGTGEAARFNSPTGIAYDNAGNLYVTDTGNSTIRKVTTSGSVTTFAGTAGSSGTTDGTGTAALFSMPTGIAYDASLGDLYVSDAASATIRKITSGAVVSTYAGAARVTGDADGHRTAARFNNPTGLAHDSFSSLFIADTYNHTLRRINTARRTVSATAAGTIGTAGNALVVVTDSALTNSPITLNVPVAATDEPATWAAKVVTALNGNTTLAARYTASSSGALITLTYLSGVDDSSVANLSLDNGTCTGITPAPTSTASTVSGLVSTIAGSPGISGIYDGIGEYALFNLPQGVAVDSSNGVLYVADTGNSCIRRAVPTGSVITVAGIAGISGKRSGPAEQALFNQPKGLIAGSSLIILTDSGNSILRAIGVGTSGVTVSTVKLTTETTSGGGTDGGSSGGGGGGGAPSLWFVAALSSMWALRRFQKAKRS